MSSSSASSIYNSTEFELGVRNLDGLLANFYAIDTIAQDAFRAVVAERGQDMVDLTMMLAPKLTGFMSEHVRVLFTSSGLGFDVGWDAADFFEAGFAFYPFFQEFGTMHMSAQPSLGPAWEQIRPLLKDDLATAARDAIRRRASV